MPNLITKLAKWPKNSAAFRIAMCYVLLLHKQLSEKKIRSYCLKAYSAGTFIFNNIIQACFLPRWLFRIYCEHNSLTMAGLNDLKFYISLFSSKWSSIKICKMEQFELKIRIPIYVHIFINKIKWFWCYAVKFSNIQTDLFSIFFLKPCISCKTKFAM